VSFNVALATVPATGLAIHHLTSLTPCSGRPPPRTQRTLLLSDPWTPPAPLTFYLSSRSHLLSFRRTGLVTSIASTGQIHFLRATSSNVFFLVFTAREGYASSQAFWKEDCA
jgi:hypothetical protein